MFGYGYMSDPEVFKDSVFKQAIEMIPMCQKININF